MLACPVVSRSLSTWYRWHTPHQPASQARQQQVSGRYLVGNERPLLDLSFRTTSNTWTARCGESCLRFYSRLLYSSCWPMSGKGFTRALPFRKWTFLLQEKAGVFHKSLRKR